MSGFAKFLLTPKELRKEKGNLSYGCPVVKVCHVKCKHDTYRIIKNTVAQTLNDSFKQLKESRLVIISDLTRQKVQAILVPKKANIFKIICNTTARLTFMVADEGHGSISIDSILFEGMADANQFVLDTSVDSIRVFVTGDLAFYAQVLGKPNTAMFYCIWCNLHKSDYGNRDAAANTTPWTIALLQDARTAKSQKTWKGVSAEDLLFDCIEPEDYIFSVLHDQMGFVNASSKHLLNWHDLHLELLPAEATTAREEFHISSRAKADVSAALKVFNTEGS